MFVCEWVCVWIIAYWCMAQLYLDVHVCVCVGMYVDHSVLVHGSALFGCSCLCVCGYVCGS